NEAAKHVAEGKNVFAKHIIEVDDALRPQDEVIVVDENDNLVAVGKAVLSGEEMKSFKHGVAIKVRRGKLD
ncbi:MAG: PUA domain-containing protein, partial [Candidatus Bathyarchaeia archaeon]